MADEIILTSQAGSRKLCSQEMRTYRCTGSASLIWNDLGNCCHGSPRNVDAAEDMFSPFVLIPNLCLWLFHHQRCTMVVNQLAGQHQSVLHGILPYIEIFWRWIISLHSVIRFIIYKKADVKFYDLSLWVKWLERNFSSNINFRWR